MQAVMSSDVTYMIVPNYCGFPCANYLAFYERSVLLSNTETEVFNQAMRQQVSGDPDVLYPKSGKYGKRSTAGDILDSEAARTDLQTFWDACSLYA